MSVKRKRPVPPLPEVGLIVETVVSRGTSKLKVSLVLPPLHKHIPLISPVKFRFKKNTGAGA